MTNTTTTVETDYQVLNPVVTAPPGTNPLSYLESGYTNLPINQQETSIDFTIDKAAAFIFVEKEVVNVTDADPIIFGVDITAQSLTGFTVRLDGFPDSTNYYLKWCVQVPPV